MREVIKLIGPRKGPTSVVMAGIHGNEPCGIKAFERMLPKLEVDRGTVYFIIGNPNALETNVRQTDLNLNRAFGGRRYSPEERRSYEFRRAKFLRQYLDEASALLDIHSSPTNESPPFVICERNGLTIAKHLPVELIVHGFDFIHPGGTDGYMNRTGKIGICIECGQHGDPKAEEVAVRAINSFLAVQKHILTPRPKAPAKRVLQVSSMYRVRTNEFTLRQRFQDFETVKKGTLIATDGTKNIAAKEDCFIVFAKPDAKIGDEGFCAGYDIL